MTLRAADVKDEHGWQILNEDDSIESWAPSRDKARLRARTGEYVDGLVLSPNGGPVDAIEVLPADNSPEAVAAKAAFDVDQRIKRSLDVMKGAWLDLAGDLYLFSKGKMWEALGYESWRAYLDDPDIGIGERQGYEWVAIYQQLAVDRNVDPERLRTLHYTKVARVLPAVRREQVSVDEALADVEALNRSDLEAKYSGQFQPQKARRGRPDTSSTIHTDSEPKWVKCAQCGSRYRVDPETGERVDP